MSTTPHNLEPLVNHVELVEKRTTELLTSSEFDPFHPDNFAETVAEMDRDKLRKICNSLRRGFYLSASSLLAKEAHLRFEPLAHKEAERQIDEETNDCKCRGAGCSSCEGEDV